MVKKGTFIAITMVVLLFGHRAQAGVSVIVNGSFEYDGEIDPITEDNTPERWSDVSLQPSWFGGWVDTDWPTHGYYNLTLYSRAYKSFVDGDMATISQAVYVKNVNHIFFDIKLDTTPPNKWNPTKRSAVLLIEDIVIWESNSLGPGLQDISGEYSVDVNGIDYEGWHKLSLGLRADETGLTTVEYRTQWDFVRFDAHCEGFGYLPGDFNHDCDVDVLDLTTVVERWLTEEPNERCDLFPDDDDIFNFHDLTVFADGWMGTSYGQDDKLLRGDRNSDGIVNLEDFAITAKDWGVAGVDFNDILILAEEWLEKNWLYGLE